VTADPFAFVGMSDRQVIGRAATHLQRAARFPPGSPQRQWEAQFRRAYGEYGRREDERVLRRLGDRAQRS
jgi:hypothetical protein